MDKDDHFLALGVNEYLEQMQAIGTDQLRYSRAFFYAFLAIVFGWNPFFRQVELHEGSPLADALMFLCIAIAWWLVGNV